MINTTTCHIISRISDQTEIPIRNMLEALVHPQKPKPIRTENYTATGFVCNNINKKYQNPGICVTIGFEIERHNNNLKFIDEEE